MNNKKNDKIIAVTGTILFHALVVLALFLVAFRAPYPIPGEAGVEVDLGMYDQGKGDVQTDDPAVPEPQKPSKPHEDESSKSDEDIVTQKQEETVPINTDKDKNPQDTPKDTPKDEPEVKPDTPNIDQESLFSDLYKQKDGNSEGETDQTGDQGSEHGIKDLTKHDGQGGQGNGISYDLGGRGKIHLEQGNIDDLDEEGKVVVDIWVNPDGNVIRAKAGAKGTEVISRRLWQLAEEFAYASKFNKDTSAPSELKGTITYLFRHNLKK